MARTSSCVVGAAAGFRENIAAHIAGVESYRMGEWGAVGRKCAGSDGSGSDVGGLCV